MKRGDVVMLVGTVIDNDKRRGYADVVLGKTGQDIQILRLKKSLFPSVVENVNEIISIGSSLRRLKI
jgi:hypothetical protein